MLDNSCKQNGCVPSIQQNKSCLSNSEFSDFRKLFSSKISKKDNFVSTNTDIKVNNSKSYHSICDSHSVKDIDSHICERTSYHNKCGQKCCSKQNVSACFDINSHYSYNAISDYNGINGQSFQTRNNSKSYNDFSNGTCTQSEFNSEQSTATKGGIHLSKSETLDTYPVTLTRLIEEATNVYSVLHFQSKCDVCSQADLNDRAKYSDSDGGALLDTNTNFKHKNEEKENRDDENTALLTVNRKVFMILRHLVFFL